jgi:hypothetical protein
MAKTDFRKLLKNLYAPGKEFALVEVPKMQFVKFDGKGDPNTAADYRDGLQWVYSVSYALKFTAKKLGKDYVVPPLESLWFADDMSAFVTGARDEWRWTQMIMAPDWIHTKMFVAALAEASKKLGSPPPSLRFEAFDEGLSAQILFIGPYADEAPVIAQLHKEYLPENGLTENGLHHEIYLSDPRKTAPAKLKTIIRQPIRRLSAKKQKAA